MARWFAAVALWFLAGWTVGAFSGVAIGASEPIGPIAGLAAALAFAIIAMVASRGDTPGVPGRASLRQASKEKLT